MITAAQVAKKELALECDYEYEAQCQTRFKAMVEADPALRAVVGVPAVVPALSGSAVITTELVPGVHIDKVRHTAILMLRGDSALVISVL